MNKEQVEMTVNGSLLQWPGNDEIWDPEGSDAFKQQNTTLGFHSASTYLRNWKVGSHGKLPFMAEKLVNYQGQTPQGTKMTYSSGQENDQVWQRAILIEQWTPDQAKI